MKNLRVLRKVRKEFEYTDYIEKNYSIKSTANDEIRICCPACGDYKYKLYVNDLKKCFNCFKCGFSNSNSDVFDFVAKTENISRGKAMLRLAHEYAETTPDDWGSVIDQCGIVEVEEPDVSVFSPKTLKSLPSAAKLLNDVSNSEQKPFWDYISGERGLTEQEVKAIKCHYVSEECLIRRNTGKIVGDLKNRILIPIYGGENDLVSWIARTIVDKNPKYLHCPDTEAHRTLWPYVKPSRKQIILTEGILDALAVRRLGADFPAYCTFGKQFTRDQWAILTNWNVESVVLMWDMDAKKDMESLANKLKMNFKVFVADYTSWPNDEDKIDAGSCLKREDGIVKLEEALKNPIEVDTFDFVKWRI